MNIVIETTEYAAGRINDRDSPNFGEWSSDTMVLACNPERVSALKDGNVKCTFPDEDVVVPDAEIIAIHGECVEQ